MAAWTPMTPAERQAIDEADYRASIGLLRPSGWFPMITRFSGRCRHTTCDEYIPAGTLVRARPPRGTVTRITIEHVPWECRQGHPGE